jgi:hypothetical protein
VGEWLLRLRDAGLLGGVSSPGGELLEALRQAAIGDLPHAHASPLLYQIAPDHRRAVVLLALDRAPEPWLVAALCEIDGDGVWRALAQSGEGRLLAGASPEAVEASFGQVSGSGPAGVMMVAGESVPVTTGGGYYLAVNWTARGLTPPPPTELPAVNDGGFFRWTPDEDT